MTTSGRWSPNKVRQRLLQDSWAFPNSGMVLIRPSSIAFSGVTASITVNGSVSFSAVSSLSLNGVFTSSYDNYMIVLRNQQNTSSASLQVRLSASGTEASGSDYTRQYIQADGTAVIGSRSSAQTSTRFGSFDTAQRNGITAYIYGPFLSQPTAMRSVTMYSYLGGAIEDYASTHSLSTSYNGCVLFPSAGSFTGLVSVYGLGG